MKNQPLVSVITVAYNNRFGLEETIKSVTNQSFNNFEFMIIDGNSNDGTKELLESYATKIDFWVSEPDKGIYNAMNKGIDKASGKYLIFMNSGDTFSSNEILENVSTHLNSEDVVFGDVIYLENGNLRPYKISPNFTFAQLLREPICHQSAFFKKQFMLENGMYNETYKIASDHIFNLKTALTKNVQFKHLPINIAVYDRTGISTVSNDLAQKEVSDFLNKNVSAEILAMATHFSKYKKLYESKWGEIAVKLSEAFNKIRYRK